jgi:hypothetical protein
MEHNDGARTIIFLVVLPGSATARSIASSARKMTFSNFFRIIGVNH